MPAHVTEFSEGELGFGTKELEIEQWHEVLKAMHRSWLQNGIPGVSSVGQGLGEVSKTQGGIIGEGTHRVEEVSYMLLRFSFSSVELLEHQDLVSKRIQDHGHFFGKRQHELHLKLTRKSPFSFLTMASISKRVKSVAGFRETSDERFMTAGSLLLVGVSFCVG